MRSDMLSSAGKVVTGKNVSAVERKCLQCHGKHHSLDKGSSVSTHTLLLIQSCTYSLLTPLHAHLLFYLNYMLEIAILTVHCYICLILV
jgi:hypothetical protein